MNKLIKVLTSAGLATLMAAAVGAETIEFNTRTEAEEPYIYEEMGSNDPGDGKSRYHDGYNYIIYEFPCPEGSKFANLTWKMQAQYKVLVTNGDPDDWDSYDVIDENEPTEEEVANGTPNWGYANGTQYPTYDLSKYCENNESGKIYVMMADATEDDGWGGYIYGDFPVTYYVGTEPAGEVKKPKTVKEIQEESLEKIEAGTQGFVVNTDVEKNYLYKEEGVGNSNGSKFLDGNGYVIYEFKVNPGDAYAAIEWVLNNQFKIEVNVTNPDDDSAWVTAYEAEPYEDETDKADWGNHRLVLTPELDKDDPDYETTMYIYRHDLSKYLEGNSGKIWVKVGDVTTENGWGGFISVGYPVTFKSDTSVITWKMNSGYPAWGTDFIETDDTAASTPVVVDEPELVDTTVTTPATVETPATTTAAQTFDAGIIAAVATVVSLAGYAVTKKH